MVGTVCSGMTNSGQFPATRTLTALVTALLLVPMAAWSAETPPRILGPAEFGQIRAVSAAPPVRTAAELLRGFLEARGHGGKVRILTEEHAGEVPAAGTILLGTTADSPVLARWVKEGRLSIHASEAVGDAYEIARLDGCVAVNGANARAVLYGMFELQDVIAEHGGVPLDLARRAAPTLGLRLLHPRVRGGFGDYRQSDFEFLARCGGNVAHLMHDWMPEKTLFSFVASTGFPKASEAKVLEQNRGRLRQDLDWCKRYGLDGAMWLCEIPCQGGPWVPAASRQAFLDRFPAECLSDTGTYQGKVLCLAHPQVEQEYRRMVRQFLTDFPGITMFLVFTLDSGGELCDPASCPRHRGVSKLSQYNRLLALMAEEGRKVRPAFQVFSVGWGWKFRNDRDFWPQQAALPAGAGLAMPPDGEAWSFDRKTTDLLVKARTLTREHGQAFLGYDIFLWGDDTVFPQTQLYDFPLGIAAKLRRWQELGADGFFDQWGTMTEYVQCNAIALRELVFHPQNAAPSRVDAWAQSLAARRFGAAAAPQVVAAWQALEVAQQIQSDHAYYWHHLRPNWAGPTLKCPLTLEALQAVKLQPAEPPKPLGARGDAPDRDEVARARVLGPALCEAADHFAQAAGRLEAARLLLPGDHRGMFDHWYEPPAGAPARLTPGELIEQQLIAVRLQEKTQRRMGRFFQAYAIARAMPPLGTQPYAAALAELQRLRAAAEGVQP